MYSKSKGGTTSACQRKCFRHTFLRSKFNIIRNVCVKTCDDTRMSYLLCSKTNYFDLNFQLTYVHTEDQNGSRFHSVDRSWNQTLPEHISSRASVTRETVYSVGVILQFRNTIGRIIKTRTHDQSWELR